MIPWAIIPTAGKGTRLLPATAAIPKCMMPVGTRPMLDWAIREAVASSAGAVIVVVSPDQPLIRQYAESLWAGRIPPGPGGRRRAGAPEAWPAGLGEVELHFVEQPTPAGFGEALIRCRPLTGADPFGVVVPDNWFDAAEPPLAQVFRTFTSTGLNSLGLIEVRRREASLLGNVGRVELQALAGDSFRICRLGDKSPGTFEIGEEPSILRGCARYCLTPEFYEALEATGPPISGEWDDVPAFQHLIAGSGLAGHRLQARHFDVGQRAGYLAAMAYLAGQALSDSDA